MVAHVCRVMTLYVLSRKRRAIGSKGFSPNLGILVFAWWLENWEKLSKSNSKMKNEQKCRLELEGDSASTRERECVCRRRRRRRRRRDEIRVNGTEEGVVTCVLGCRCDFDLLYRQNELGVRGIERLMRQQYGGDKRKVF